MFQVLERAGVSFSTKLGIVPYVVHYGPTKFYIGKEKFYPQSYGFALPTGAPYKPMFDSM